MYLWKNFTTRRIQLSKWMIATFVAIVGIVLVPQIVIAASPLAAPDLIADHDFGISNTDNLTNAPSATYTGSCVTGETIKLYDGATVVRQGTCNNSSYTLWPSSPMADGVHHITATATDSEGESEHSPELVVTIDTAYPDAPSRPDLTAASDTGRSNTDDYTKDTTPTFTGTCDTGNQVKIRRDNFSATGNCSSTGTYTLTLPGSVPYDNNTDVDVTQIDDAGNPGPESQVLNPYLDVTLPDPASKPDLVADSDTGRSNIDNVTKDVTPTFTGTCAYEYPYPASWHYEASIRVDEEVVGEGTCSTDSSTFSVTTSSISDGTHNVDVLLTDLAGNTSENSESLLAMKIDSTAPYLTINGMGGITTPPLFTLSGTAEANSIITAKEGNSASSILCLTGGNSNWGCTIPTLSIGSHILDFTATDVAGNASSTVSRTYSVN